MDRLITYVSPNPAKLINPTAPAIVSLTYQIASGTLVMLNGFTTGGYAVIIPNDLDMAVMMEYVNNLIAYTVAVTDVQRLVHDWFDIPTEAVKKECANFVRQLIPSRFDLLCLKGTCEINQPNDDEEYEPRVPLYPGTTVTLFYAPERVAARIPVSSIPPEIEDMIILYFNVGHKGEIMDVNLRKGANNVVVALGPDEEHLVVTGEGGVNMVVHTEPGVALSLIADKLSEADNMVFLGAMIIDTEKYGEYTCKREDPPIPASSAGTMFI